VDLYRSSEGGHQDFASSRGLIWRIHERFNAWFERLRDSYLRLLDWVLAHARFSLTTFAAFVALSLCLIPFVGQDFFPAVDAGTFRLHVRVPPGTRIEETERIFAQVEDTIRATVPPAELDLLMDDIGIPNGSFNLAFGDGSLTDVQDGEILVSLKHGHHPTAGYRAQLRQILRRQYPDCVFYFQASDIVNQILNFGLPAPIDIQVSGREFDANYALAQQISHRVAAVPGAVDVHVHQVIYAPELLVNVDRSRAQSLGLTESSVASSMLFSLSGTGQTSPNYWLNPRNGVNYSVNVLTPQYKMNSLDALGATPITAASGARAPLSPDGDPASPQTLANLATIQRLPTPAVTNHYNVQPVFDVYVNTQGRDLGSIARDINRILPAFQASAPRGTYITVRGQVQSMSESFTGLGLGMFFAVLLVYLLMVVNFQSWLDPFIILTALPGAACGILWMLLLSATTFSVPSLMGAIMTIGVATANSILLVTFANDQLRGGMSPLHAASSAGFTRLRPVLMTALAMIIGMLPMSLGLGEGGEQNAPLGRAVIGGLIVATLTTLLIVPVFYSLWRKPPSPEPLPAEELPE